MQWAKTGLSTYSRLGGNGADSRVNRRCSQQFLRVHCMKLRSYLQLNGPGYRYTCSQICCWVCRGSLHKIWLHRYAPTAKDRSQRGKLGRCHSGLYCTVLGESRNQKCMSFLTSKTSRIRARSACVFETLGHQVDL